MAEQKPKHKEAGVGMVVVGDKQFVLSKADNMQEAWALHEMGGMQPRVGWIGCVYESMGYVADARKAPTPESQWIFGYDSLQKAAEALVALVAEKRAAPTEAVTKKESITARRTCDRCNKAVLLMVVSYGQTVFCDTEVVTLVDDNGVERTGHLPHRCGRR